MYKSKENALTTKVLSCIPKNLKATEYLMGVLNISKESSYRRLRGEIPFTFAEISKMALDLGFSVDEVISLGDKTQATFSVDLGSPEEDFSAFTKMMQDYYAGLTCATEAQNGEVIVAMNNLLPFFLAHFDSLFRFAYFKSTHKNSKISLRNTLSETELPSELEEIQTAIKAQIKSCTKPVTIIIDSNIVLNLINDIIYFHKRKLITEAELKALKADLLALLDAAEEMTQTGYFAESVEVNLYLSFVNVDANSLYMKCDEKEVSSFYLYNLAPINTSNHAVCDMHRKKIDSLKKYSRLITQSNEIIQSSYFDLQRGYVQQIEHHNIGISF
jgi:hypothetical protein